MSKYFAEVRWCAEDAIEAARQMGITLTPRQAEAWWQKNEQWFRDALTEYGNEVLASVSMASIEEAQSVKEGPSSAFEVELDLAVRVESKDIDDVMCTALEGGITYWCRAAKPVGERLGEYAHEQISRGGSLMLYDAESSDKWELTLGKFLRGVVHAVECGAPLTIDAERGVIDLSDVDADLADTIVQYALFGELMFS